MAHPLRPFILLTRRAFPSPSPSPIAPSYLGTRSRCLSCSRPRWANTAQQSQVPKRQNNAGLGSSPNAKALQQIPSDIGLLPGTFVTPTGRNLPPIFHSPRAFSKLQWIRLKTRFQDRLSLFLLKFTSPKGARWFTRTTLKLRRRQIVPAAVRIHKQMYTAFAEVNLNVLREICAKGILDSFRLRLASRAKDEKVEWELLGYNKRPRIVSDRAYKPPAGADGTYLRQAVVKMCTRQKLRKYKTNGQVVPGTGKEKDVVEYLVLQKVYVSWNDSDWRAWGTTDETTLEDVEEKALAR